MRVRVMRALHSQDYVLAWVSLYFDDGEVNDWQFDEECKQAVVVQSAAKKDSAQPTPRGSAAKQQEVCGRGLLAVCQITRSE